MSDASCVGHEAPCDGLPEVDEKTLGGEVVKVDLNKPMKEILAQLSKYPPKTRLSLSGPMIVARDLAHAKLRERLESGQGLPDYFKDHPVYYAGPAKTPEGYASGAFGPTTAGRMDSYIDQFQEAGGSMILVAKGNRSAQVREACKKHGGFYLASIGGSAANLAEHCIKKVEVQEYPRARHGSDLAHRGRGLPRLHRHRRQGQRLLQGAEPRLAGGASPPFVPVPAFAGINSRGTPALCQSTLGPRFRGDERVNFD